LSGRSVGCMSENERAERHGESAQREGEEVSEREAEEERLAKRFAEEVIARGEAVEEGAPLTGGATHEIVRNPGSAHGAPAVRRRRYSAF
jgi:hypothetical protein